MNKESFKIFLTFLVTVFLIYGLPRLGAPPIVNQALFLLIIAYIFTAKDDLFWLCWYFVVVDAPGRLFSGGLAQDVYRLPLYNVAPGISIAFQDIFLVMYMIKAIRWKIASSFIFKNQVWLFISIGLFYFGLSFAIGISFQSIITTIRAIIPWFWLVIIPRYVTSKDDMVRVYKLIIPMAILAFIALIQTFITGAYLHDILSGMGASRILEASQEQLARVYSAFFITFLSLVLSLHFLTLKKTVVNSNLLIFIAFLASVTIFLSGTRGWIIVLLILYSSFFFISGFGLFKQFVRVIVIVGLSAVVITSLFPLVSTQGSMSFERLLTLESLTKGDLTAGGTLSRLTERGPRVMAVFRESPIIGWAFSDRFYAYGDIHVGNQTNLLNLGIIGFIWINLIYLSISLKTYWLGRRPDIKKINGSNSGIFLFALLGLFFAHSSSSLLWGYMITQYSVHIFWAFFFAAINVELSTQTQHN